MEIKLNNYIMVNMSQEFYELLSTGLKQEYAFDMIKEKIRNEYDSDIWELVDDEENELELDFDDILNEIMDDIESRANYYYENNLAGN